MGYIEELDSVSVNQSHTGQVVNIKQSQSFHFLYIFVVCITARIVCFVQLSIQYHKSQKHSILKIIHSGNRYYIMQNLHGQDTYIQQCTVPHEVAVVSSLQNIPTSNSSAFPPSESLPAPEQLWLHPPAGNNTRINLN